MPVTFPKFMVLLLPSPLFVHNWVSRVRSKVLEINCWKIDNDLQSKVSGVHLPESICRRFLDFWAYQIAFQIRFFVNHWHALLATDKRYYSKFFAQSCPKRQTITVCLVGISAKILATCVGKIPWLLWHGCQLSKLEVTRVRNQSGPGINSSTSTLQPSFSGPGSVPHILHQHPHQRVQGGFCRFPFISLVFPSSESETRSFGTEHQQVFDSPMWVNMYMESFGYFRESQTLVLNVSLGQCCVWDLSVWETMSLLGGNGIILDVTVDIRSKVNQGALRVRETNQDSLLRLREPEWSDGNTLDNLMKATWFIPERKEMKVLPIRFLT